MSELSDRIAEVLDDHFDDLPPSIRDWISTPDVAERIEAELQLTEEKVTAPVWVLNDPLEMDDRLVTPRPKQHIEWIPKRRWVSTYEEIRP